MIEVGIFGATGKVGKLLIEDIIQNDKCKLSSVYVRNELQYDMPHGVLITRDMESFVESSGIIIDFSSPQATQTLVESALKNPTPLVIGTTGLINSQIELIKEASKKMPILYSANMSMGIAALEDAVIALGRELQDFDIEITESHHRYKKDAPSGTALSIANKIINSKKLDKKSIILDRQKYSPRKKDEIGIVSLRGGDVVGKHTVGFYGDGEYLEITHTATSRSTFSKGALKAALWLYNKPEGFYEIHDMFKSCK